MSKIEDHNDDRIWTEIAPSGGGISRRDFVSGLWWTSITLAGAYTGLYALNGIMDHDREQVRVQIENLLNNIERSGVGHIAKRLLKSQEIITAQASRFWQISQQNSDLLLPSDVTNLYSPLMLFNGPNWNHFVPKYQDSIVANLITNGMSNSGIDSFVGLHQSLVVYPRFSDSEILRTYLSEDDLLGLNMRSNSLQGEQIRHKVMSDVCTDLRQVVLEFSKLHPLVQSNILMESSKAATDWLLHVEPLSKQFTPEIHELMPEAVYNSIPLPFETESVPVSIN